MKNARGFSENRGLAQIGISLPPPSVAKRLTSWWVAVLLLTQQVFAPWAAHLVISPASLFVEQRGPSRNSLEEEAAERARGVSVHAAADKRVQITLKLARKERDGDKAYYLVISQKRLGGEALDLRKALHDTNHTTFEGGAVQNHKIVPAGFVELRPLQPVHRNGESVIEVVLDRETALRSYVVWDFRDIYELGAAVMDGGLWLTYDLPAFVEREDKAEKRTAEPRRK